MGRTPAPVTVADAIGRAERNLGQGQRDHAARVAAEIAALPEAQQRVIRAKRGLASYHHKPSYRVQDGEPTQERERKAPEGFERVDLATGEPIDKRPSNVPVNVRSREVSPMLMPEEIADRLKAIAVEIANNASYAAESRVKVNGAGILDTVLSEYPHEREALANYVRDYVIVNKGPQISSYGGSRSQGIASERRASVADARYNLVEDTLPLFPLQMLEVFAWQMTGIKKQISSEGYAAPSPKDVGCMIAASTDHRVGRGAYIGAMRIIATTLNEIYADYQTKMDRKNRLYRDGMTKVYTR
jgi:hypothetical protein